MRVNRETQCIERSLNALLQGDLDTFRASLQSDLYWPYIVQELRRLRVDGLFYAGLRAARCLPQDAVAVVPGEPITRATLLCPVPMAALEFLRRRAEEIETRNRTWMQQTGPIFASMNDKGILPVLIGGTDLAYRVYSDDTCRDQDAVDIFVPRAKVGVAHDLLLGVGYLCATLEVEALVPSSHKVFRTRVDAEGAGDGRLHYVHNSDALPPLRVHYRLWPMRDLPHAEADALEREVLQGSKPLNMGDAIVRFLAPEHALAYFAARAYYDSYENLRFYFDAAAMMLGSYYSSQPALVNWSTLRAFARALDMEMALYYFFEILGESINLPQRELFAGKVGRLDLITLHSLKHRRFNGRPNFMVDMQKAHGFTGKARAILRHVFLPTKAS